MILKHFFHYIYLLVQHLELGYFMRTVILFPWPYSHIASNRTLSSLTHSGTAAAAAMSLQTCPTLCDPIDGSPPGSPVPGILQARTLEWVAISFSNA